MSAGRYDRRYLAKVTVNVVRFQESRLEPSRPIAQPDLRFRPQKYGTSCSGHHRDVPHSIVTSLNTLNLGHATCRLTGSIFASYPLQHFQGA
jgi:hypothetical protein